MIIPPLRERDGKLRENWYIACLSKELRSGTPLARKIYEKSYVLFRGADGKPSCFPDRCLHRAVRLSEGDCRDGNLTCPYHGWVYAADGRVVAIPSGGPQKTERDLRIAALPTLEQDGCIWVWMGDGPPQPATPPWRFPRQDDSAWTHYFMITDFPNEVTHLAENFMDVPHTIFVHKHWFRTQALKEVPIDLEVGNRRVLVTYHQPQDAIGWTQWLLNPRSQPMVHTDEFIYPNITRVDYAFGEDHGFIINSQCTPIETLSSRVYTYIAYRTGASWLTRLLKPLFRFYTRVVIEQDVKIMQNQARSFREDFDPRFKATDADEIHLAIERLRSLGREGDPLLNTFTKKREKKFWI
jgi:phenylpropionate dioxygenase-like ring-hydroxylating dioxygenase large terminal subunit